MTDELLFNYISGNSTSSDIKQIQEWVAGSEDRKQELARIKNVWVLSGLNNDIDFSTKEKEIERIWDIIRQLNHKDQKKIWYRNVIKYAAAIILLAAFSGTLGYFISDLTQKSKTEFTEIIVPKGERSHVVLPDGSKVQLNSDSHLKIVSFNSVIRKVLLEGEGFFEVTHDKSRPFVVETNSLRVEVLGTTFNVSSYPEDSLITTYLVSGRVKINDRNSHIVLSPDEAYSYNKVTQESTKMKMTDERYSNWTKGVLTIDGETIGELAKKLERRYNVQISFGDNEVKQHIYTGSIRDEDLNTVLEAIEFASSIQCQHKGNTITMFSK